MVTKNAVFMRSVAFRKRLSNMKAERGMVELRIIADQPPIHGASVVEPTLEDVFLYYFGEKGGEME